MGLRISTNVPSISAQRYVAKAQESTQSALKRLSSGSRVAEPGADAASFAIGEGLRADIQASRRASMNTENAISFVQVAEGGLNEQFNILVRLRELAIQSASDGVSNNEREYLNEEFSTLVEEFDRLAKVTRMGNRSILTEDQANFEFMVGGRGKAEDKISFTVNANTTAQKLGLQGLSIHEKGESKTVLEQLDTTLGELSRVRATFGAIQGRFHHANNNLQVQIENLAEARSRMVDADYAEESANLTRSQILQEASSSVLVQANNAPRMAFRLLNSLG